MATPLELAKMFGVSKKNIYFDGDPLPYVGSIKIPAISSPVETFDNTSTGGPIEIADAFRRMAEGDGEVKFQNETAQIAGKLYDSSKVQIMKTAIAVNALNPQSGRFLPYPVTYTTAAQFFNVDPGEIKQGTVREITAKFKMFSYKIELAAVPVLDFDFVAGSFNIEATDLLSAVQAII